jgi:very-short-patch-repair endonuclease
MSTYDWYSFWDLDNLCLEIHSHKRDKREIVMEIYDSLNNQTSNLDFFDDNQVRQLEESRNKINATVTEIHKKRFSLELSLYESIGLFLAHQNFQELRFILPDLKKITPSGFDSIIRLIENLETYANVINLYERHPWHGCNFKKLTLAEREAFEEQLEETFHGVQSLNSWIPRIIENFPNLSVLSLDDLDSFFNVLLFFHPTIFAPSHTSYVRDYSKFGKNLYRFLLPKYYRALKQMRTIILDGKKIDKEIVSLASTLLRDDCNFCEDGELAQINNMEIDNTVNLLAFIKTELPSIISIFQPQNVPCNDYKSIPLENLFSWINNLHENLCLLDEWIDFRIIWDKGIRLGLEEFFEKAIESKIPSGEWVQTFKKRFFHLFIEAIFLENPDLQTFKGPLFSQEIHKFVTQDLSFIEKTPQKVVQIAAQKKPVNSNYIKADSAETNILRREANKRRRIKPTRILFREIPTLIQTVKPCLLMSPFTVSQLLDPELYKFDVVIFDEASQIPPEYAVASIARGNQIIVAGDRNQLPPTRFFQKFESEIEDESEEDDFESVINVLDAAGFPTKRLKWHYRSKDESLIAFSNYHFYHNELVTFPNVDKEKVGIHHVYVPNGIYRRGSHRDNPIEAQQVCDILVDLLEENPEKSIGIVCFSQAQQTAILDHIEIICRKNPNLVELLSYDKEENVFVKNLETVQGDERDIIIFSVGYGKDENGKMGMNFGPLNKAGGERRLNVAVTRARERVYLVTSIEPEDIDLTRTQSRGVRLFKNYLETARDGRKAIYKDTIYNPDSEFDSPFEEDVYNELVKNGFTVHPQVGASDYKIDLAVVDPLQPGKYALGIECDGASYHSSATARDRDRLRQQVLEGLGWKIYRIWSLDWFRNKQEQIKKLIIAISDEI